MFEQAYQALLKELLNGKESALITLMKPADEKKGTIEDKLSFSSHNCYEGCTKITKDIKDQVLHTFSTGKPMVYDSQGRMVLIEPFFPKPRLVILGGGHIAKPLAEFGTKVGFSTVVVDDRPSFANTNRFPEVNEVVCENFDHVFPLLKLRASDFVVIITRGHRHDGVCLRETLKYSPAYIGMIGSKRRVKEMKNQLINEGYSADRLEKVNSPIGLDIGAVTPEEIAISIIAQVISFRRSIGASLNNTEKFNWPEFDSDVMKEMSQQTETPRALITIISSKGSVPRKAGAKMIVWLDGRVMGSIGGGCSEANIITLARDVIQNKGYAIAHVDMTGIVAEEEGMVCGGIMDVLIEAF